MTTISDDDAYFESLLRPADAPPASGTTRSRDAEADPARVEERRESYSSGRSVRLREGSGGEELVVESPGGSVELHVRFTASGPVLSFASAALKLRSSGDISVDCERFQVRAAAGIELETPAGVRMAAEGDVWIDGGNVLLNCDGELPPELRLARGRLK